MTNYLIDTARVSYVFSDAQFISEVFYSIRFKSRNYSSQLSVLITQLAPYNSTNNKYQFCGLRTIRGLITYTGSMKFLTQHQHYVVTDLVVLPDIHEIFTTYVQKQLLTENHLLKHSTPRTSLDICAVGLVSLHAPASVCQITKGCNFFANFGVLATGNSKAANRIFFTYL